ncbi:MAG: xanthan lyase [Bacteroidales bacterium]
MKRTLLITLSIFLLSSFYSLVQARESVHKEYLSKIIINLDEYLSPQADVKEDLNIKTALIYNTRIVVNFNNALSRYPLRDSTVKRIYSIVKDALPSIYRNKKIEIYTAGYLLENLSSPFYSKRVESGRSNIHDISKPWVVKNTLPYKITKGLQNRNIALWQSHGRYYEQSLARWEWQRATIMETVEDLYTQGYVLPYLVPMLENAGAYVVLPRERSLNKIEIIVDNDKNVSPFKGEYQELGKGQWKTQSTSSNKTGFANLKPYYEDGENPFTLGTARYIETTNKQKNASFVKWHPKVPKDGEYAVCVSYISTPNSNERTRYTVIHSGGSTDFMVNQRIGGGTWVYLGTFKFNKDSDTQFVIMSNYSNKKSPTIVSADAVKFGGGMGNIARKPSDKYIRNLPKGFYYKSETSGYPRFTEGARYWLQWAGFDKKVYSNQDDDDTNNDYIDDYKSRAHWVNSLINDYKVPIEMSLAFHSDAGTTLSDSIIGTLALYTSNSEGNKTYPNRESRLVSRELADLVQTQVVNDIRRSFEPEWNRRELADKQYYETRVPEVPSMILESLSHQNFADMRYGLDPTFHFVMSRAVYKGILRFVSERKGLRYVVQPLPPHALTSRLYTDKDGKLKVKLHWRSTIDSLEPSAKAEKFIVYRRINGKETDFDKGHIVYGNDFTATVVPGHLYSYRVAAINDGGISFPSETITVGATRKDASRKKTVLIVNNFDRISGPESFCDSDSTSAGFANNIDGGVPYIKDISYIGNQYEFNRQIPWLDDDNPGYGASYQNYDTVLVAGNTFDFTTIHGQAILNSGYNFVSCSRSAVLNSDVKLSSYPIVDFIMGKEKSIRINVKDSSNVRFQVFPEALKKQITSYLKNGGSALISGSYIATDLWDQSDSNNDNIYFAENILKIKWMTNKASNGGFIKSTQNPFFPSAKYSFFSIPNSIRYCVESPDGLTPASSKAWTIFRYSDTNISAGVAYSGNDYKVISLGFPIETLTSQSQIDSLMKDCLSFLK